MIVITGGAGFIGSNVISRLNKMGRSDIIVIDDMTKSDKFNRLLDLRFRDVIDYETFLKNRRIRKDQITHIIHMGACTDTTEYNGRYMMKKNYEYSMDLLEFGMNANTNFIYASSAAVYGKNTDTLEEPKNERPLNIYGFSKLMFDQKVRRINYPRNLVGLRFFNVFGPGEEYKGHMASMIYKLICQVLDHNTCSIFKDGEQKRDFIHIDDVCDVILHFFKNNDNSLKGIFNVGTGIPNSFNAVANCIIGKLGGGLNYIDFPEELKDKYQNYTRANLQKLREVGYNGIFSEIKIKIEEYCDYVKDSRIS